MQVKFSVIVPVYQQWHFIEDLVRCMESQVISKDLFELVLISNDGRSPSLLGGESFQIKTGECKKPGSYAARNRGAELADGDWLIFTDADCLPDPKWIAGIDRAIRCSVGGVKLFAGDVRSQKQHGFSNIYEVYDFMRGIPQEVYVSAGVAATANMVVDRFLFLKFGGFSENSFSSGDFEFCRRLRVRGYQILFLKSAFVHHRVRCSWRSVAAKAKRIKGGQFFVSRGVGRFQLILYTLLPPVRSVIFFWRKREVYIGYRLLAIFVQLRLWGVEIWEMARLMLGAKPERH
ncbi:rhamnosyl transferase [Microbulbifer sp. A4B17]|uniref:glycosyltransferase n=1 Tax=Microbulbifer sp. A4B17 TaxID=359370 RepID=UPI000D52AC70|nr:glycosyltransferase [Microbulbifer sp. A4B17]AWF81861.1 rhamnosyl transferase [Microbulbifer sp. A4B17]